MVSAAAARGLAVLSRSVIVRRGAVVPSESCHSSFRVTSGFRATASA
jgi:hypothetical protein